MKSQDILTGLALTAGALYVSFSAFTAEARREIGRRDKWECQCGCGRRFQDGWMVQAAHDPDKHQKERDVNPDNGRILATECHIREELRRGNINGARLLHSSQTVRQHRWINVYGEDPKEPLEYYMETMYEQDSVLIEA